MSDFLAGIAARAFPQRDAIQPRVATRYEPVSPKEAPMFTQPAIAPAAAVAGEAPAKPAPLETRFEEIERVVREIAPAEPRVFERESRIEHETRVIERESPSPAPPATTIERETIRELAPGEVHHHHHDHDHHYDRERTIVERQTSSGAAGSQPAEPAAETGELRARPSTPERIETRDHTDRIERTERVERVERVETRHHTDRTERRETRLETNVGRASARQDRPQNQRQERQQKQDRDGLKPVLHQPIVARRPEAPPEPPSVHVTIGRVEIRAALPAEKPRPAARAQGPSLEEYLRRRDGRTSG